MKNERFKEGLHFGIGMTVFFIIQNFISYDNHTTAQIIRSLIGGIIAGALAGFLFGWLIGLFKRSKFNTEKKE
jgi:NhaP-type Na+/H+ or K+/H+ antiporter